MVEGVRLVPQIWTLRFENIFRCIANTGIKEERDWTLTKFLNMFSKQVVEELADLVKASLQDQVYASSFRSVHLTLWTAGFVAGAYVP